MDYYDFDWIAKENEEISALINFVTPKQSSKPHQHGFYEFSYILGGTGYQGIDDTNYEVQCGDITFVNPKEVHQVFTNDFFTNDGKLLYVDVYVSEKFISRELKSDSVRWDIISELLFEKNDGQKVTVAPVVHIPEKDQVFAAEIFNQMCKEYAESKPHYQEIMKKLFLIVVDLIVRCIESSNGRTIANTGAIPRTVMQYIDEHYRENITLKQLAAMSYMQPAHFCKQFKKCYNITFLKYIHKKRIDLAVDILKRGNIVRIGDIGEYVGYNTRQQFYKYFHQFMGCTPSDYVKKRKNSNKEN